MQISANLRGTARPSRLVSRFWAARLQVCNLLEFTGSVGLSKFGIAIWREAREKIVQPFRPLRHSSGMCAEQLADFIAACDGKITWRQYFAKWGDRGLTL